MKKFKNNKGITLIALVITIIVIIIIASISIIEGTDLIKKAKVESIMTNMIIIKSQAKGYAEEINSQVWDMEGTDKDNKKAELFEGKGMKKTNTTYISSSNYECYSISKKALNEMSLEDIAKESEDGDYIVAYYIGTEENESQIEIIYKQGIKYENDTYHTLTEIQEKVK